MITESLKKFQSKKDKVEASIFIVGLLTTRSKSGCVV